MTFYLWKWYKCTSVQNPDPLVIGTDPRIRIRTKMSWIPNNDACVLILLQLTLCDKELWVKCGIFCTSGAHSFNSFLAGRWQLHSPGGQNSEGGTNWYSPLPRRWYAHRDTYLELQETEKIKTEMRDVDKIRITKVYAFCSVWPSRGVIRALQSDIKMFCLPSLQLPPN